MTTESKQRAANIKARREALGISFEGFYDQLGISQRHGEFVENGQYGKLTTEHRELAEKFLVHLELKKDGAVKAAAPIDKPHVSLNDKTATQKQLEKFADGLCQSILRNDQNIITIPWAQFYELLYASTGCGHFELTLLESIFSNQTFCKLQFMISFGEKVVFICKDTNFAPASLDDSDDEDEDAPANSDDEDEDNDPDIKQPTTW